MSSTHIRNSSNVPVGKGTENTGWATKEKIQSTTSGVLGAAVTSKVTQDVTAKVVLMKSDPVDILRAIILSKATVRKMKQNLFWASIYNLLAIPIAGGILYPKFGIMLRPEFAALLMSISSIIVAVNAVLLKRVEPRLRE